MHINQCSTLVTCGHSRRRLSSEVTSGRLTARRRECERDSGFGDSATPLGKQARQLVGRDALAQERGETLMRRRLGELALEAVTLERTVGVAAQARRALKIAATSRLLQRLHFAEGAIINGFYRTAARSFPALPKRGKRGATAR